MMKISEKNIILLFFLFGHFLIAQKKEFKCEKVYDAVSLIDNEKYDDAVQILRDCEKIAPAEYTYPYEIALAFTYQNKFQEAVNQLEKIKNYQNLEPHFYQLLGNNFDYLNHPEKAISTYNEGLKKFPNAGRLYLEKGVILESQNKFKEAIDSYEKGVSAEPIYSSNYYRLSKLYLNSNDKLSGLINGEIFVNLERTTKRTQEISKLIFETYQKYIGFKGNETKVDFCDIIIDDKKYEVSQNLPFCAIFGKNFVLALIPQSTINLETLSAVRTSFLDYYFKEDFQKYPNVLLDYHKKMLDSNVFEAYNRYVFQMGAKEEFEKWENENPEKYQMFVNWYINPENYLKIDDKNLFISDSVK